MKYLLTTIIVVFNLSAQSQSLNENPYLTYYLGQNLEDSSLGAILGRTYDGISKIELSKNIPSSWINGYSLNHLPVTARYSDFITPFGRSYLYVGSAARKSTSLSFLGSNFGEMDMNLSSSYALNKKKTISTNILLNYHHFQNDKDGNNDQFLDQDKKQKFLGINHWNFKKGNYSSSITAYHLNLNKIGGDINFNKEEDYLGTINYGWGTDLNHTGIYFRNSIKFTDKEDKNITKGNLFIDGEIRLSDMQLFQGTRLYDAQERHLNAYLGYSFKKGLTAWEFGMQYRNEKIEENINTSYANNLDYQVPGIYGKVETGFGYRVKLQADLRLNYHDLNNEFLLHPGMKLTYMPTDNMTIATFSGNGTRYARSIVENSRYLYNNRNLVIEDLLPEKAWHYGISYRWQPDFQFSPTYNWYVGNFNYYFLFYHNIYQNLNVASLPDTQTVAFNNHQEKAYKTSLNNRLIFSPFKRTSVTLMHRFDVFKLEQNGELNDRLYHPKTSFMFSMDYSFKNYVNISTQVHIIGKTPVESITSADGFAPKRKRWDMSISVPLRQYFGNFKTFKKFDAILGFDNITGNKNNDNILGTENPFSTEMDAGLSMGNPLGARIYGGINISF